MEKIMSVLSSRSSRLDRDDSNKIKTTHLNKTSDKTSDKTGDKTSGKTGDKKRECSELDTSNHERLGNKSKLNLRDTNKI